MSFKIISKSVALLAALTGLLLVSNPAMASAPAKIDEHSRAWQADSDLAHALSMSGDTIVFASSQEPMGLDPALIDDAESGSVVSNLYESLLRFDFETSAIEPSLATSWAISKDGRTYTFKLRQGVKFHDGTDFNAEAVKYNFDRQMVSEAHTKLDERMASYAPFVFGGVDKVTVVDDYTIDVKLKASSVTFLRNMAISYAAPIVSPTALKKNNHDLTYKPVGTGPYRLVEWKKGRYLILTAFDDHWDKAPDIKHVFYRIIPNFKQRLSELRSGSADIINGIDPKDIEGIRAQGGLIYEKEGNNVNYMLYNCRDGYETAKKDVRVALTKAINIHELVQRLYLGYADAADCYFPSYMQGYDPRARGFTYDAKAARKYFAENKVEPLKIMTYKHARMYNTAGGEELANTVKEYLALVGLESEVIAYDWAEYRQRILTDEWDICFLGWVGDNGDPDNFINFFTSTDPSGNQSMWIDQEFNALIKRAAIIPDGPGRNSLYRRANKIIYDEAGFVPISHAKELLAYSPNVWGTLLHFNNVRFVTISKY